MPDARHRRIEVVERLVAVLGDRSLVRSVRANAAHASVPKPSRFARVRILLVSQMYPGPDDPDLGVFVATLERELAARGHELERAVVDRRAGGRARHLRLARDARRAARRFDPDVVYAHFLVPAGLAAALASRAPLVVTAHGQDVANVGRSRACAPRRASSSAARRRWSRSRTGSARVSRTPSPAPPARPRSSTAASTSSASRRATPPRRARSSARAGRHRVPLPRLAHRAQERAPARARVRAARRGDADVRRRRPAAARARGPRGDPPRRTRPARRGPALDRRRGRRLPAEPRRAVRPRDARGDGVGALGRRHARSAARPSSSRPRQACSSIPSDEDALVAALDAAAALPRPNPAARAAAEPHDVRLQAARVEAILERAVRDRRA